MNVAILPLEISQIIESYYAEPIKKDALSRSYDIRNSSLAKQEAIALAKLVYSFSPSTSLEIGLGPAASCIAIAATRKYLGINGKHIALDPYQEIYSGSSGLLEIAKANLKDYVTWLPERSEVFLSAAHRRGETFDFIFVDGAHDIGQTVTDAFYVHRTLNPGGLVAFHDSLLFSTAAAVRYLLLECEYSLIAIPSDSFWKTLARIGCYLPALGVWYAINVIPYMHRSIVILQKPNKLTQNV